MSDDIKEVMRKYHDLMMNEIKAIREENKTIRDENKREFGNIKNTLVLHAKILTSIQKTLDEQTKTLLGQSKQ